MIKNILTPTYTRKNVPIPVYICPWASQTHATCCILWVSWHAIGDRSKPKKCKIIFDPESIKFVLNVNNGILWSQIWFTSHLGFLPACVIFVKCKHIIWECYGTVLIICIKWETTETETLSMKKYKCTRGYSHLPNALCYHT